MSFSDDGWGAEAEVKVAEDVPEKNVPPPVEPPRAPQSTAIKTEPERNSDEPSAGFGIDPITTSKTFGSQTTPKTEFGGAPSLSGFGGNAAAAAANKTSFDQQGNGFGGAAKHGFGGVGGAPSSFGANVIPVNKPSLGHKTTGFGGEPKHVSGGAFSSANNFDQQDKGFGGAASSGFGNGSMLTNQKVGLENQTTGVGASEVPTSKPSSFGQQPAVVSGFGGAAKMGFGGSSSSGFGGQKAGATESSGFPTKETSTSQPGFGGDSSTGFGSGLKAGFGGHGAGAAENSGLPTETTGFGGKLPSAGFGASSSNESAFGQQSKGFGGATKNGFGGDSSSSFGSGSKAGFGGTSSSGIGGQKPGATESSGFPTKETSTSGGTFGSGFGGKPTSTGFGAPSTTDSSSGQQTAGFGGASKPGFGGDSSTGFGSGLKAGFGGHRASTAENSGLPTETTGFGGKLPPAGFGASSSNESAFGQQSKGFGGATKNGFGGDSSNSFGKRDSGFGGPQDQGFGDTDAPSKSGLGSFNTGGGAVKSAFGAAGFGSSSNFGNGNTFGEPSDNQRGNWDGGERPRGCHNCGEEGHISKECDKPKVPRFPCRNCEQLGHFASDCDQPRVPRGPCRNCGIEGHFAVDCDQPKVPRGPCRNCGQEGHFAKDCQNERVRMEPTEPCRRCAEEGHWGYECPTRPKDLQGNFLESYDFVFTPDDKMFEDAVNNDDKIDFDQKVVASTGKVEIPDMASFDGFKILPQDLHDNLKRMKMNRPTPIQRASFFPIMHGNDVVACAHTGSGKTLAFLIPFVIKLMEEFEKDRDVTDEKPSPRLLIVAPTRELVNQTFTTARQLTYETGLKCGLAFGGYSRNANVQHLRSFSQLNILVATMGRLQDFVNAGEVSLSKMKYIVLDEADRMVDSNDFGEEVSKIIGSPGERTQQTVLFSASFSEDLQSDDLPKFVKEGYTMLQVDKFGTANEKIDQKILPVPRTEKRDAIYKLLGIDENTVTLLPDAPIEKQKTLIFVNSVKFCDTLAALISSAGVSTISMHSYQNQEQRDRTLDDFRRGKYQCMVASNVCARGLNIAGLDHVVNYDMPDKNGFDEYVNRIGRTGRAGFTGTSTAFVDVENDTDIIPCLVSILNEAKKEVPEWLTEGAGHQEEGGDDWNEQEQEW